MRQLPRWRRRYIGFGGLVGFGFGLAFFITFGGEPVEFRAGFLVASTLLYAFVAFASTT